MMPVNQFLTLTRIKPHLIRATGILVCWTFLALIFTPQTYVLHSQSTIPLTWIEALSANLVLFYGWAILTPFVFWFGEQYPIEAPHQLRNTLVLLLLAIPFALVHMAMLRAANTFVLNVARSDHNPISLKAVLVGVGATDILVYLGIIGVSQAITYFQKYKDREYRFAQAQLQALKMQIHPHFLFNTLNAISELVYDHPELADRTITQLSDLLRTTLQSSQNQEITLREELEFLKKYLEIQKTLLQERLTIEFEIDRDVLPARVPNLVLQPLVENAIRHGIAPRISGGAINIRAFRHNGSLKLQVSDDGIGLKGTPEQALGLGIGLPNTRERLKRLYGENQQFEFRPLPDGGLSVNVTIPFHTEFVEDFYEEDSDSDR
jgi:glucose-6-phosphate-specific signal transduction histidine kinase